MSEDYKINVSAPGADETKRKLEGIAQAEENIGKKGKQAAETTASAKKKNLDVTDKLLGSVKRLVTGYVGLQGVLKILGAMRAEMDRIDESTERTVAGLRGVMALSSVQGERKETKEAIFKMSAAAGRPVEQVATAYYSLLGGTAGMDREKQQALMQQSLLMGKTDTRASLDSIVGLFTTIASQNPTLTPTQIGNLASTTIEQAKSTPEEMAAYLPGVLSTTNAGGVDPAVGAAMFSFATRKGGGVAGSGTAVRATLLGLLSPTGDVAEQMGQYGYNPKAGLLDRVNWLAANGENLPPELVAALGGRRGLEAVSAISRAPDEFNKEIGLMRNSLGSQGSLLQGRLQSMYGEDEAQLVYDQLQSLKAMQQIEDYEPNTMRQNSIIELTDLIARRKGKSGARRFVNRWTMEGRKFFGNSPRHPWLGKGAEDAFFDLLDYYKPEDLMEHAYPSFEDAEKLDYTGANYMFRQKMTDAGIKTYGGQTFNGGTHYHVTGGQDPAGRFKEQFAE